MKITQYDFANIKPRTDINIICHRFMFVYNLAMNIAAILEQKSNVDWDNGDKNFWVLETKSFCMVDPLGKNKNFSDFINTGDPQSEDNVTFFCNHCCESEVHEMYKKYVDSNIYSFEDYKMLSNNNIIVLDHDKISYHKIEKYDTYPTEYNNNKLSRDVILQIIYEIENKNSIYHHENGWLRTSLSLQLILLTKCYFITDILTCEPIDLPIDLRNEILEKVILLCVCDRLPYVENN